MRVLFNATDAVLDNRGLQRYVASLAAGLPIHAASDDVDLVFFTHRVFQVRAFLKRIPKMARFRPHYMWLPRQILRRRFASPHPQMERIAENCDLYHESTFDSPRFEDIPVVTTIHGLPHIEIPEMHSSARVAEMDEWVERALRDSDYFICVSRWVQQQLIDHYRIPPERTRPVHMGVGKQFYPIARHEALQGVKDRFDIEGRYLLYVGRIEKAKNIDFLLEVYARLVERELIDGPLVLAGDLNYDPEEFQALLRKSGVGDRVKHVGTFTPSDPMLPLLYRAASVFLFPSHYEGWASAPLEAMACGTPAIVGSSSAIPETVGQAAQILPCDDAAEWADHCEVMMNDMQIRSRFIQLGMMRAAMFTWQHTVKETWKFYRDVVNGTLDQDDTKMLEKTS